MPVKMTLWAVTYRTTPTFYLDAQVQGIVSAEHAARIATEIVKAPVSVSQVMAIEYLVTPPVSH